MNKNYFNLLFKCIFIVSILPGCALKNYNSPTFSTAFSLISDGFTSQNNEIESNLIDEIPYASLLISFGNNTKSLLILETIKNEKNIWTSSDSINVIELNGRIIRTVGLPNDLYNIDRPKLKFLELLKEEKHSYTSYYSFRNPSLNNLKVDVSSKVLGNETIEILGKKMSLIRIEESLYGELINWRVKNLFWIDPETGFVWQSRQYISPNLPYIDIQVTKKPAR